MTGVPQVQPGVLEVVAEHVHSVSSRKVGGILLGRALEDATRVDAALPARETEEFAGEIAFPSAVWEEAYARLDEFPGATIVGWYHSHPGSGVRLSDYDRRLHKVLFGEPYSVALVVDPMAERMAWFGWEIEQLWPLDEGAARSEEAPAVAATDRGVRAPLVAALVALGLVAGAAGGYWVERAVRPGGDRASIEELGRQLASQRSLAARLQEDLDRTKSDLAAERERVRSAQAELEAARRALDETRRKLAEARRAPTLTYTVQPGDTLWDLADTFLGDPREWRRILSANRTRIADPTSLEIGQIVVIPLASGT